MKLCFIIYGVFGFVNYFTDKPAFNIKNIKNIRRQLSQVSSFLLCRQNTVSAYIGIFSFSIYYNNLSEKGCILSEIIDFIYIIKYNHVYG